MWTCFDASFGKRGVHHHAGAREAAELDLLERTGLTMDDMAVVKNHNPFAVNDAVFQRITGYDWRRMNKTGCSLVWGHPQGPTLTRTLIEALEEAVENFAGCVLVISHDRWFLDRIATHMLAFEGDSQVVWFEGNFQQYDEDLHRRLGKDADQPHRIKYRKLAK